MTAVVTSPVVQAVTDAVSGALTGALADVRVLEAVDPIQQYAARSVTIGGTWDPDAQAFATDQTIATTVTESGAARRQLETTSVQCIAYVGSGDNDFPAHRTSVAAILAAIREAMRALGSVAGAATRVQVGDEQWAQGADDNGTFVMSMFTVQVARLL